MTTVSAPGSEDENFSKQDIDLGLLEKADPEVTPLGKLRIDATRAGGDPAKVEQAKPDTIVELILEGDLRWITTVRHLEADFPGQILRSATAGDGDQLRLPTHLGRAALRGGGADGIKINGAAIFDIDIDDLVRKLTKNPAATAGTVAGDDIGPKLAEWFDERQVKDPGLYRLNAAGQLAKVPNGETVLPLPDDDQPYLLFLHGTASTTEGSFGGLWTDHKAIWDRIHERYQGRILALEHRTLATNPIANALMVAKMLPDNARLHIVSHSRGGMIGELLCRSGRVGGGIFDDDDIKQFKVEGYDEHKADLIAFHDLLFAKKITVERFVRVACPAAGTTLADGKLDRWLSALMNVVGKIGADVSVVYNFVRGFLLAVVKTRAEPEHIPGLEAMMPGSPLTRILNRPDIETTADLTVIAGDIDGKGVFHRLGIWLTDLYYQGDHDLVVDTASMYGGLTRPAHRSRSYFEDGPNVYHFRYFKNGTTAQKVWDGLRRQDPKDGEEAGDMLGFTALPSPPRLKELQNRSGEPRPSVFILPGILGSELGLGDQDRIWLDPKDILKGKLLDLAVDLPLPKDVRVFDMLPRYYNELANFLAASINTVHLV